MVFRIAGKNDPIRELLIQRFGNLRVDVALGQHIPVEKRFGQKPREINFTEESVEEVLIEKKRLSKLKSKDLDAEFSKYLAIKIADQEASNPVNKPSTYARFDHWLKMPYWSIVEGLLLINNRDPRYLSFKAINENSRVSQFAKKVLDQFSICERHKAVQVLQETNSPETFVGWAEEVGFEVFEGLKIALEQNGKSLLSYKLLSEYLIGKNSELETQLELQNRELEAVNTEQQSNFSNASKIERQTLLKLVSAMACEQYNYDPKNERSPATSAIRDDIESVGLSMDNKTILKWLKEASALVSDDYWEAN